MEIAAAYSRILCAVRESISVPPIRAVWFPDPINPGPGKFGMVVLEDGATGIAWGGPFLESIAVKIGSRSFAGVEPASLAADFGSADLGLRTLALAASNAIAQHVLRRAEVELDYTTDPLEPFAPDPADAFGMVGYFPPLVRRLSRAGVPLLVLEQQEKFLDRQQSGVEVTLDPKRLRGCNKIVCTGAMIINGSVDDVLSNCRDADLVAVVGPSLGFFPDALFDLGVHAVGATHVESADELLERCRAKRRWGDATRKYSIWRKEYPGYEAIVERARER